MKYVYDVSTSGYVVGYLHCGVFTAFSTTSLKEEAQKRVDNLNIQIELNNYGKITCKRNCTFSSWCANHIQPISGTKYTPKLKIIGDNIHCSTILQKEIILYGNSEGAIYQDPKTGELKTQSKKYIYSYSYGANPNTKYVVGFYNERGVFTEVSEHQTIEESRKAEKELDIYLKTS